MILIKTELTESKDKNPKKKKRKMHLDVASEPPPLTPVVVAHAGIL
jgi:hypothetical protein